MNKTKLILAIVTVLVILLACLGFLGYFGVKSMRRTHLRMEAREAYAAEDWKRAEKLLNEYVEKDHDSEEDLVLLANVYRHFGDTEKEMRCWARASMLNPLKTEYWDIYTECAMNARSFGHLYSSLSHKALFNAELAPRDQALYLICMFMTNRVKDAEQYYERILKEDPEAFQRDDLGRFAEFLITYKKHTLEEHAAFIEYGIQSDDPVVRLESILFLVAGLTFSNEDEDAVLEQKETMLKEAVALNWFAATPLLADFYFTQLKFNSVIEIAEPYLADIEDLLLSVLYAESCVYAVHPEKLIPLIEHFRSLGRKYRMQVSYFEALYDFSQGAEDNDELSKHMQELGAAAQTDLANLINLQVSLNNDNVEKICSSLETIMKNPPFYDLQERARSAVRHYLGRKIEEDPSLARDPRMVKLVQFISRPDEKDPFLMRITVSDLNRRNVLNRQIIQENLDAFPLDPYLLQVAAEFELFNGNPEQCLEYTERFYTLKEEKRFNAFDLLHMLALELMGKIDEATKEYTALVDNNEMDRKILYRYFRFCIDHERQAELSAMADRLEASSVPDLKALAPFFRAEGLLLQGKTEEALSMLESAQTDHVDFALRAANLFTSFDKLDQALSRYLALVDKHPDKLLVFANIAEVYLAREMKEEALSYAERAWETNPDNGLGQFVYAKMLAANGRYQDAERVLRVPHRKVELSEEVRELWTDIILHCVQDDLDNHRLTRVLERANHYLILYPDDFTFQDFKARVERELKAESDSRNPEQ